jgi:hypothetical protein
MEELNELSLEIQSLVHSMMKALRFGIEDKGPDNFERNRIKISKEANDVIASFLMLGARGMLDINEADLTAKFKKVEHYMDYARQRHALDITDGVRFRAWMNATATELADAMDKVGDIGESLYAYRRIADILIEVNNATP